MEQVVALVVLGAWMWREREHSRERHALWERLLGVSVPCGGAGGGMRARAFGDAAEWEIEQERVALDG